MTGAEGRQGTGGDSWEGHPHNSDHGQTVHLRARGHLKNSNPCECQAGADH